MKKSIQLQLAITSFIMFSFIKISAQDVHFSQIEYAPLSLNPALAGANSMVNGVLNYRSQWNSVAMPYKTISVSVDGRFNENKRRKNGIIAGGLNFYNDQTGDLKVNTNSVNLNLAYHLILEKSNTIGLGIYSGFGQRSINSNAGRWTSQYDGTSYNSSASNNETFNMPSYSYMDIGAGVLYAYKKDKHTTTNSKLSAVNVGIGAYHVNRPNASFLEENGDKMYVRWSFFANANIGISNTKGSVMPAIYIQKQGPSTEFLYGLYYKNQVSTRNGGTALYFGIFNRFKDAMAAKFMIEMDHYSAGFCYDVNISSLNEVSKTRGGFELFLRFSM